MKESAGLKVKWKEVPTEGLMEGGDGFKIGGGSGLKVGWKEVPD